MKANEYAEMKSAIKRCIIEVLNEEAFARNGDFLLKGGDNVNTTNGAVIKFEETCTPDTCQNLLKSAGKDLHTYYEMLHKMKPHGCWGREKEKAMKALKDATDVLYEVWSTL